MKAVLFDAVETLIRPWPFVGSVYARAAAGHGLRCPARALEAAFRPAYSELFPARFFGRSGLQTSEPRERRWWGRVVARTFERAGCGTPGATVIAAGERLEASRDHRGARCTAAGPLEGARDDPRPPAPLARFRGLQPRATEKALRE